MRVFFLIKQWHFFSEGTSENIILLRHHYLLIINRSYFINNFFTDSYHRCFNASFCGILYWLSRWILNLQNECIKVGVWLKEEIDFFEYFHDKLLYYFLLFGKYHNDEKIHNTEKNCTNTDILHIYVSLFAIFIQQYMLAYLRKSMCHLSSSGCYHNYL